MIVLAAIALLAWLYLALGHGGFWQIRPVLTPETPQTTPTVVVVVPARDEAPVIAASLRSLLAQDYAASFHIVLVDDGSTDDTGAIARGIGDPRLRVLTGAPRPPGWSGKLWAVSQGVAEAAEAELLLLTDADIVHDPRHLASLVARAERDCCDLVSEMVALACDTAAERALVPAYVYFFALLYPFAWVNDSRRATAAAAGGTMLIRRRALDRIGGIAAIRGALIDDVTLAAAVKQGGRIWLGHGVLARSTRPYATAREVWRLIARTAYVQLRFSPVLLGLTTLGMATIFLVPPVAAMLGTGAGRWMGLATWTVMAATYVPLLRRFGPSPLWAPLLPAVAVFYMAATIGSAVDHVRGRGLTWKGRAYGARDPSSQPRWKPSR
jgi:hopene-associated glycosyltransferase HpnB